jgi:hypothetical protein
MKKGHFIPTVIIIRELHAEIRGYSLLGREFVLKEPLARKEKAITLDGEEVIDDFWIVTKEEYIHVCPEAQYQKLEGDIVLIPTFIAQPSFRPSYVKQTKLKGF